MVEKANPWWRKTLNYARGEIRTGFGILPGPPKLTRDEEEGFFERLEQILNVEAELTDQSPNPETTPVTPVDAATQDHLHEPVQNPRPFMASAPVQEIAPVYLPATEPTPRPEPEMEAVVESVTAVVSTPVTEPSPAPANEPLALAKKSAPRSPRKPKAAPRRKSTKKQAAQPENPVEPVPSTDAVPPAAPFLASTSSVKQPVAPPIETAPASEPVQPPATTLVLIPKPVPEKNPPQTPGKKSHGARKKPDDNPELSPFSVSVDKVYDGPLDLLLDLIRKQDIDIYDIPIARITAQFLAYVNQLKASDVDVAGEFIYTASLLIHIKSKMLLPHAIPGPDDAPEDPRRELVERLLEHERFKIAAQMLQQKQVLEAATWTNPGVQEFQHDAATEPEIAADTVDLVRIFRDILERARNRPIVDIEDEAVTVGQMIRFLARRLTMEDRPVALRRLFDYTRSERALVAMFLALLELVRLQAVLLRQDRAFSEIFIKKHKAFEAVMNEGLANARDDWR